CLKRGSIPRIPVGAEQSCRAVLQSPSQCFTALDGTDEPGRRIDRRAFGGQKLCVHVNGRTAAAKNAEKRAPSGVGVTDAHHVGTRLEDAGVDRPLVRWSILAAKI